MHKLALACGRYDRTQPLIDGRVQPDGVNLTFLPLRPGETFWRMLNHDELDASEMSLSSYTMLRSEGDTRFIADPGLSVPGVSSLRDLRARRLQHRAA
jgi:4,5-dihydroxyphthalate decarboxylase